jgi:serine/threonine-protein kinase
MSLAPGSHLGPYEIVAPLGAGGMGEVYKARDTRLDRIVAIKIVKEQFSERFEREARAVAQLNHPHICQLYDVGPDYLVMELVEGTPLKGPLPIEKAIEYAGQILDALDAAHKKGITHRDLKPANMLVTKPGIKLLDFGLAKQTAPLQETDVTRALTGQGQILGTLQYLSPEQLQGKEVDARSDLFSFGCVLYEMLTGKRAFDGASSASVIAAILEREPAPLEVARPLDRVVRRSLAKDPDQRFQTARDLKAALSWALDQRLPQLRPGWNRQHLPWAVAVLTTVVAAIALGAVWHFARAVETTTQPAVRLDLDLGPDVSLRSTIGPTVILSPDGTRLVFVSQGADGTRRLFTRRLDQPKGVQLSGTEGAYTPFFSPDGQWVGFFAQGKLKKTRIDGGEPVSLWDAPAGRGASWAEDGNIIAALDTQAGLSQVPPEGGKAIPLTELGLGELSHRWPQVLPGGQVVLFTAGSDYANFDGNEIAVVSLKDHRRKTVLEHAGMYPRYLPSGHLVYVTKGTLFAVPFDLDRQQVHGSPTLLLEEVSSDSTVGSAQIDFSQSGTIAYRGGRTEGLRTLQWLDSTGKTESLSYEPAFYWYPRFSPDGSRLALLVSQGATSDLWIYDLQRGNKIRLTNGTAFNSFPVWSPDGRFVVFQSAGGMFWTQADGAGKSQPLTESKSMQLPTSFTPDGTRLVFSELTPGTGAEIRTVPVQSGSGQLRAGEPQLFLKTSSANAFTALSPDGRWLAFADIRAGSYEVYVRAFPDNGTQVQISNAGGIIPLWSRNGHELFYRTEEQRIMVANYTVKGESFVADKPRVWYGRQLASTGQAVNYDLAPDGKRFLVLMPAESAQPQEAQNHVMLVVNFFDEVRRRVAGSK